jgi:D-ribose pyranase
MKKIGTLNTRLSYTISQMGHSDKLVICDCGLPIPRTAELVDLALSRNIPRFLDTVRVVLEELCVERAIVAKEMETVSKPIYCELMKLLHGIPVKKVTHKEFKRISVSKGNVAFVRTGEATAYANIILFSGVTFE